MAVQPIPEGYHTVTPYLIVNDGVKALEFYEQALGATETLRMPGPDGKIGHAEIKIGDSPIMLADEFPAMGARSPKTLGGVGMSILLYVDDADAMFDRAIAAGATVTRPLANQFYGDRSGTVTDPFGHIWTIATHVEDVTEEEMARRAAEMAKQTG
jgi:PhnB protein